MENSITCGNPMMEKPSHISPVKYTATYSTQREQIMKCRGVTRGLSDRPLGAWGHSFRVPEI